METSIITIINIIYYNWHPIVLVLSFIFNICLKYYYYCVVKKVNKRIDNIFDTIDYIYDIDTRCQVSRHVVSRDTFYFSELLFNYNSIINTSYSIVLLGGLSIFYHFKLSPF